MKNRRKPSPVLTEIMSKITNEDREKTRKEMMREIECSTKAYKLITRRYRISTVVWITDDEYYVPEKYIVKEHRWIWLNEPCTTYEEALNVIEADRKYESELKHKKTKITEDIIKEIFIGEMNWWDDTHTLVDDNGYETTIHYYTSPCGRYVLTYDMFSNICDENGDGWNLHIDNSDMNSIGNVSVNYVEEVVKIMDIFKNY